MCFDCVWQGMDMSTYGQLGWSAALGGVGGYAIAQRVGPTQLPQVMRACKL